MHSFRSKTHILGIFTPFRCSTMSIWFRTTYFTFKTRVSGGLFHFVAARDPLWKSVSGASNAWVYASDTISCIVTTNMPNTLFQSKTLVLGGSMPFRSRTWHVAKTGFEAHLMHEFMPLEPFLVFLQQTCPFHFFRSKTHVLDGFAPFHCRTWPVAKICIGVHLMLEFMLRIHFLFGRNEHSQSTTLGLKVMFTIMLDTSMHFYIAFDDS